MNATYDYKGVKKSMASQMKKMNGANLIISMTLILCASNIINHFIAKWDGHFHDTKGCTSIQNMEGKLYQVNSCENSIVPIASPAAADEPLKNFNTFNPDDMPPPPAMNKPAAPLKKLPHPKEAPKDPTPAPYMT